ncbi:MAG: ATP-binding protein [Planctomycetota bacterium]
MIKTVEFENFKAFKKVTIPLEPLTVFVGPNSSGKTSVLHGLKILSQSQEDMKVAGANPALSYRRGGTGQFSLRVVGGKNGETEIKLQGQPMPLKEELGQEVGNLQLMPETNPYVLGNVVFLELNAIQLATPSYSQEEIPTLSSSGGGLASVLVDLQLREPERFSEVANALKAVIPAVERLRFKRARVVDRDRGLWSHRLIVDFRGAKDVPAYLVSQGTLLALAFLTVLLSKPAPQLVLMDDIDHGLHPKAQWEFIKVLRKIMAQNPELQILATSHSPYFLDELKPEEVRMTSLDENGEAHCAPLLQNPDFEKWKDDLSAGELWSVLGDEWVNKLQEKGAH